MWCTMTPWNVIVIVRCVLICTFFNGFFPGTLSCYSEKILDTGFYHESISIPVIPICSSTLWVRSCNPRRRARARARARTRPLGWHWTSRWWPNSRGIVRWTSSICTWVSSWSAAPTAVRRYDTWWQCPCTLLSGWAIVVSIFIRSHATSSSQSTHFLFDLASTYSTQSSEGSPTSIKTITTYHISKSFTLRTHLVSWTWPRV